MTPKSFEDATSPSPKWNCQIRLTITRDTKGFSGLVSQRPSQSLRWSTDSGLGLVWRASARTVGTPGSTAAPASWVASFEDVGNGSFWSVLIPDVSARQLLGLCRLDSGDAIV